MDLNINNENMGYKVATNGKFVAIGNPNSNQYDVDEGFSRTGEVLLYFNDSYSNEYTLLKTFKKPYLETLIDLDSYAPVYNAYNYESGSYNHNSYGKSLDITDKYIAIGDPNFLQKIYYYTSSLDTIASTASLQYASVEIYKISESSSIDSCNTLIDSSYVINDSPVFSITGSSTDLFGYNVSISNNYLLIGAPNSNNNSGSVFLYQRQSNDSYSHITTISSSDDTQSRFGASVSIDKKTENKFIIGTDAQSTGSKVFIYNKSSNDTWDLYQTLSNNTSSQYLKIDGVDFDLIPISQSINDRYGYSVDIEEDVIIVGCPNDLIYYEYDGSNKIRSRGSFYIYAQDACVPSSSYDLKIKSYGDSYTFKDNLLGYDVSINNKRIAISSPKPYFPFSSLYLSASIDTYIKNLNENDLGEKSFNGQVLLYDYDIINNSLNRIIEYPINYRKKLKAPYSAFGYSVDLSEDNIVIGSPVPLNLDNYLNAPILIEQSASAPLSCSNDTVDVMMLVIEDEILNEEGEYITASIVLEQNTVDELTGRSFIYDFSNIKENYIVGNVFYNNSKIIINNTGSMLDIVLRDPSDPDKPYVYMDYSSQIDIFEKQYICTIEPGEFNISTNPTSLNVPSFEWNIYNHPTFDFEIVDTILRYIHSNITINSTELWEETFVSGEVEQSIFNYYSNTLLNYSSNRLTNKLKCELSSINLDVNGDSKVNIMDGYLIWKYFCNTLTVNNYNNYITQNSNRKKIDELLTFLNEKSGKSFKYSVKDEFFQYKQNSNSDITGSYLAPYITHVGLYSNTDLVGIAKLGSPIKNSGEIPINIVVKWDI